MTINNVNANYPPSMQSVQKENTNNSQESQQNDISNNTQNKTKEMSAFQMNIFESVKQAFGHSINSEGFFTSDLNEAAGIPKDIKIDSSLGVKYYLLSLPILGYYNSIDLKGSVENFYNSFSKLSTQEQDNLINRAKETKYFLDNGKEESLYDILLEKYSDGKGGLNQSGKLEIFIRMNPSLMVGEKTINLAIQSNGAYASFIDKNDNLLGMNILDKGKAGQLLRTSTKDMSPEEFGKQWAELRKEYQAKYDEWQEQLRKENEEIEEYNKNLREQKSKNKFKPIQATSKSETYQDTSFLNTLDLIKSRQKLEQILMLFGERSKGNFDIQNFQDFLTSSWKRLDREI